MWYIPPTVKGVQYHQNMGSILLGVEGAKIEDHKDIRYLNGRVNHPKDTN